MAPSTEDIEVRLVLEAIHARYGQDYRGYRPDSIRRRLSAVMSRFDVRHLGDLQHRLLVDPAFFATVSGYLTVTVTAMFRDPPFYVAFREHVVPVLRSYPQLKVWHAGCASGEEVYSLAIVLLEEKLYDRTQIYATDVSAAALADAADGLYPQSSASAFEDNYRAAGGKGELASYFTDRYGRIAMKESLRDNIVFFQHDLTSDYALGEMQVIFCRNVLIYFDAELRSRVVDMFGASLCRGGFLCLGGSESLPASYAGRLSEFCGAERIYRRTGEA